MVDCRECKYFTRSWKSISALVVINEMKCNAYDNPMLLKTFYRECKVWTKKENK